MTNAWFLGATGSVPQTEHEARATTEPIRTGSVAEQKVEPGASGPDFNEVETDDTGETNGLAPRVLGSETVETEQFTPWWTPLADENHNKIVDDQVASSGTAARRESAGEQGHGTMQYALGIEPVIREGAAFGADYFTALEMGVQQGSGAFMQPIDVDRFGRAIDGHRAEVNSRDAYQASMYDAFLKGAANV